MSNKNFDWSQDLHFISIKIPISGVSLKKIDVFISDLVVKVNVKDNNFLKIFDLHAEVEYDSPQNSISYQNGILDLYIQKKKGENWPDVSAKNLSKEEIRKRREDSFKRRDEAIEEAKKSREKLGWELDRHATEQHMKIEDKQRDEIKLKKTTEKENALNDIYSSFDEKGVIKESALQQNQIASVFSQQKAKAIEKSQLVDIVTEKGTEAKAKTTATDSNKKTTDIFDDNEVPYAEEIDSDDEKNSKVEQIIEKKELAPQPIVQKELPKPKPITKQPRNAGSVQMKFTEKVYPNMATREQHFKEPPLPKTGQYKKDDNPDEQQNPLWMRDKGNELFGNQDYASAINAYTIAYTKDKNLIGCVSNRAICYLSLYNYDDCISDCNMVLEFIKNHPDEKDKYQQMKNKALARKAIGLSWKGYFDEARTIFQELIDNKIEVSEEERAVVHEYLQAMEKRSRLNLLKKNADIDLNRCSFEDAIKKYQDILQEDPEHEIVQANLALTQLKTKNYEQSIECCDKVLQIIKTFRSTKQVESTVSKTSYIEFRTFLVKILLRKSKALESLNRHKEAFNVIEEIFIHEPYNAEAKKLEAKLKVTLTRQEVDSIKDEAGKLVKEKKFAEALEKYNECLKKIHSADILTFLAVILNKCICHMSLQQFEEIISLCIRGLNIISNHKIKVISFTDKNEKKEMDEKVKDFEIRFLVRRSNAYLQTKKFYHAKSDLEEALKLDPKNEQIKRDLDKINDSIASK